MCGGGQGQRVGRWVGFHHGSEATLWRLQNRFIESVSTLPMLASFINISGLFIRCQCKGDYVQLVPELTFFLGGLQLGFFWQKMMGTWAELDPWIQKLK